MAASLLDAFPLVRTRDVDALQSSAQRFYGDIRFGLTGEASDFEVTANHCQLGAIGLTYARHGTEVEISLPNFGSTAMLFAYRGQARVVRNRTEVEVSDEHSFVGSHDDGLQLDYSRTFEQLVLKIQTPAMLATLEGLTGHTAGQELRFLPHSSLEHRGVRHLQHRVLRLVHWLSANGMIPSATAQAELEQSLIAAFLDANRSNYSDALEREPLSSSERNLRLIEDYIETHWDQPMSIPALATLTGESARSLFYNFKRKHGCTPMLFVRLIRLHHAFRLLSRPEPATSVTDAAFACGFGNLGHFTSYYRQQFGEAPSETLRRGRQR